MVSLTSVSRISFLAIALCIGFGGSTMSPAGNLHEHIYAYPTVQAFMIAFRTAYHGVGRIEFEKGGTAEGTRNFVATARTSKDPAPSDHMMQALTVGLLFSKDGVMAVKGKSRISNQLDSLFGPGFDKSFRRANGNPTDAALEKLTLLELAQMIEKSKLLENSPKADMITHWFFEMCPAEFLPIIDGVKVTLDVVARTMQYLATEEGRKSLMESLLLKGIVTFGEGALSEKAPIETFHSFVRDAYTQTFLNTAPENRSIVEFSVGLNLVEEDFLGTIRKAFEDAVVTDKIIADIRDAAASLPKPTEVRILGSVPRQKIPDEEASQNRGWQEICEKVEKSFNTKASDGRSLIHGIDLSGSLSGDKNPRTAKDPAAFQANINRLISIAADHGGHVKIHSFEGSVGATAQGDDTKELAKMAARATTEGAPAPTADEINRARALLSPTDDFYKAILNILTEAAVKGKGGKGVPPLFVIGHVANLTDPVINFLALINRSVEIRFDANIVSNLNLTSREGFEGLLQLAETIHRIKSRGMQVALGADGQGNLAALKAGDITLNKKNEVGTSEHQVDKLIADLMNALRVAITKAEGPRKVELELVLKEYECKWEPQLKRESRDLSGARTRDLKPPSGKGGGGGASCLGGLRTLFQ